MILFCELDEMLHFISFFMKRCLLWISLFCLLLVSCVSNSLLNVDKIALDNLPQDAPKIELVSCIALNYKGIDRIGSVCQMKYRNGEFYLFDREQGLIMAFDSDGNETGRVKALGHGVGEYIQPMSFDVDAEGNVFVADAAKGAVYEYSRPDFKFKRKINVGTNFCGLGVVNENEFWITSFYDGKSYDGKLAYYNAVREELKTVCKPVARGECKVPQGCCMDLFRSDSVLYFYERFTPLAYRLNGGGICSDTLFIESENLPTKKNIKEWGGSSAKMRTSGKIIDISALYMENGNVLITLDYNAITRLWCSAEQGGFVKFTFFGNREVDKLNTFVYAVADSYYVSYMYVDEFLSASKKAKSEVAAKAAERLNENIGDANVVLLLYSLRD